ncbi:MAG TPA: DNA repair helicase XPB [Treponemataceae bacterium]|nr:DNA repair helicase XPB [Treponemataceae bacterium]
MHNSQNKPLIVQSDKTILLDVHASGAEKCRNELIPFAELERSPEHLHTYRITALSLWNAASAGFSASHAISVLHKYSRFTVPESICMWIEEIAMRFGKLCLVPGFTDEMGIEHLYLITEFALVFKEIDATRSMKKYLQKISNTLVLDGKENLYAFSLLLTDRGTVKQALLSLGWPVKDEVPLKDGDPLDVSLKKTTSTEKPLQIRDYQKEAAESLVGDLGPGTGFGTIVLPCGAGKTIVGMIIMDMLKTNTLILTTNISAVHQWIDELIDKTNLTAEQIGEYTGERKKIKPVTVATYQVLTWRPSKKEPYPHFQLFRERAWGLIIYDEVHLLPAPVFRVTAELQAVRRVGLTATLVREDGCEGYVFSLVGPKRYDVPWKELESTGWIAEAECIEVRLDLDEAVEIEYAISNSRKKHRIASENPAKMKIVKQLVERYKEDQILIIGQYLDQLYKIAKELELPVISGKTPSAKRDEIFAAFRTGELRVLVVSKVANFAIDLPDASMAIQVSGTFGSRQEEAQRLGRILRPKDRLARFITLITRGTLEEDFGANRQKFLAEQGYTYRLVRSVEEIPDYLEDCYNSKKKGDAE